MSYRLYHTEEEILSSTTNRSHDQVPHTPLQTGQGPLG